MGFFDQLTGLSPAQNQGLLAAAAALLQAGGPSRMPTSFGQALGGGLQAFQTGMNDAEQRDMARQQQGLHSRMLGLQLQGAEADLADQAHKREVDRGIEDAARNAWTTAGAKASTLGGGPTMAALELLPKLQDGFDQQRFLSEVGRVSGLEALKYAQQFAKAGKKNVSKWGEIRNPDGSVTMKPYFDDGTTGAADNAEVAHELKLASLGDSEMAYDPFKLHAGQKFDRTMTFAERNAAARLAFDKQQAETNQDAVMDPLAVRMVAQQYLAGDTSALQNFGRGAQGAKNLNAVRLEISKLANAQGLNGADIAAKVAEFSGVKAGQRTAGTRSANIEIAANEAAQLAPLALEASRKVSRSGFLPFGKAQIMFDSNTNDPNLRQFAMANTALVNAYGQAMARGGTATVSDKDHARELLSTTFDQKSYEAAVQQLQAEIRAAQVAPRAVRKGLSGDVSGRDQHGGNVVDFGSLK